MDRIVEAFISFHPERTLFHNFGANPQDFLCGVPIVRLRVIY